MVGQHPLPATIAELIEATERLDAFGTLQSCRKALVQRNANPQMVAERALFALREASAIG